MHHKTTGSTHTLYRYGGTIDGKQAEVKIGTLAVGTRPDDIPAEIRDNMTPKEMRELVDILDAEHIALSRQRVIDLVSTIDQVAPMITPTILDADVATKLTESLARATAAVRRVRRQQQTKPAANNATSPATTSAANENHVSSAA